MIFRNWVLQNFPFLEDDFDALIDYELFCKMVEYMKESLKNIESFKSELDSFQVQLDEYKNYFDNLDVQEEINNKLDEMAESGQLQEIIAEYLNLITNLVFNTVQDMKEADNLINGNYVKTLGFYDVGDGGESYYLIRNVTTEDDIDEHFIISLQNTNLVAEFILIGKDFHSKQVGLKGDDLTDETTYIQKYFNFMNNYNINKIFDSGIYVISSTIYVKGKDQQDGNNGSGWENGFATIKFNDASFHHINPSAGDYSFIFYGFWEDCIDGFTMTRNSQMTKTLIIGCYRTLFKNFEIKNLEISSYSELVPEELRFYSCAHLIFQNGYVRGQLIINPKDAPDNYINSIFFKNVQFFSYGYNANVVLKNNISKQQLIFTECDMSYSTESIFDVEEYQVNPYVTDGISSCSIVSIANYFDSNLPMFKNNNHNNVRFVEFGSRYSGNYLQIDFQTMKDYLSTTRLGISSNYMKNQLPVTNLNLLANGDIEEHTREFSQSNRLFGISDDNITKSYVANEYARHGYVRRLTFNNTNNVSLTANGRKACYTAPATFGMIYEVVSGGCDILVSVGYNNVQTTVLEKDKIKSGINIVTLNKNSQVYQQGAWLDVVLQFSNLEPNTVIDIYEIGVQSGELYLPNAPLIDSAKGI